MNRLVNVALAALLLTACNDRPRASAEAQPQGENERTKSSALVWERTRQCAEQAERLASRIKRENAQDPKDAQVMGWDNHYNQKEQRCYVQVSFLNPEARRETGQEKFTPLVHVELYDAFENLRVGIHTRQRLGDAGARQYCRILNPSGDRSTIGAPCETTGKFMLERMTQ
jgi:hypothetical protein